MTVYKPLSSEAGIEDNKNSTCPPLCIMSEVSQIKPTTSDMKTDAENEKFGKTLLCTYENKEFAREKVEQSNPSSPRNKAYTENSKLSTNLTLPLHENKEVTRQTVEPNKPLSSVSKVDKENSKFSIISTCSI